LAAVFSEECDQRIHGLVIGAVDDEAAFLPALRQACARESGEMERERRRRQLELLADRACGESRRAGLDQEAEDRQTRLLSEGGKGWDRLLRFHISNNMEMSEGLSTAVLFFEWIEEITRRKAAPLAVFSGSGDSYKKLK
jgi:hypothetical protein